MRCFCALLMRNLLVLDGLECRKRVGEFNSARFSRVSSAGSRVSQSPKGILPGIGSCGSCECKKILETLRHDRYTIFALYLSPNAAKLRL